MEGVVRAPSAFAITAGSPPSNTETQLLVVPKSIPTALARWWFTHPHGAIFNLEWLSSQKVEPDRLKVATYRNYLSLLFIPRAVF